MSTQIVVRCCLPVRSSQLRLEIELPAGAASLLAEGLSLRVYGCSSAVRECSLFLGGRGVVGVSLDLECVNGKSDLHRVIRSIAQTVAESCFGGRPEIRYQGGMPAF
jgi:hypothetical protein